MNKLVISYSSDEDYFDINDDINEQQYNKNKNNKKKCNNKKINDIKNIDSLFGDVNININNNTLSTQIIYYLNKYKSRLNTDIQSDPNKDVDSFLHKELKDYLNMEIDTINNILMEFCNHKWVKDLYEHCGEMIECEVCVCCDIEK